MKTQISVGGERGGGGREGGGKEIKESLFGRRYVESRIK